MEREFRFNQDTAVVKTTEGTIQGYFDDGLYIFKGVPYAEAERFHDPHPAHWEGIKNCTSYGYVCPLLSLPSPNNELLVPHRYWVMNEDCMNLNVWTEGLDDQKRPVIVWLHGGGFESGSAIEHIAYEGENLAKYAHSVIVSVNHRLNILGYFDLSDYGEEYANSGNAGTSDLIAALEWIRDNIARFGGDPGNITLFGQSGGGCKITALLQSPAADGLFHKGLIMSGVINTAVLKDAKGSGKPMAEAVMKELGISDVHELEKVPYSELAKAYTKVRPSLRAAGLNDGGNPHPNAYYFGDPLANGKGFRKETAGIPLIVGTVFGEFSSFCPTPYQKKKMTRDEQISWLKKDIGEETVKTLLPLFEAAYPERDVVDLDQLDCIFRYPTMKYIEMRAQLKAQVWSYLFNMDSVLDNGTVPWHCSDVPYVFHNCQYVPTQVRAGSDRLEDEISGAFASFARSGDFRSSSLPEWKSCTPGHEYTMILDEHPRVRENFDHELIQKDNDLVLQHLMTRLLENAGMIQH